MQARGLARAARIAEDFSMRKQQRADHLLRRLEELYPETPIPLDHKDSYTLLVAVLLSAQCTDVRVNQVTPALFAQVGGDIGAFKDPYRKTWRRSASGFCSA
jgi:endonuclease-3